MTHVHGPGKRWEGTRYTCSYCRGPYTVFHLLRLANWDAQITNNPVAAAYWRF